MFFFAILICRYAVDLDFSGLGSGVTPNGSLRKESDYSNKNKSNQKDSDDKTMQLKSINRMSSIQIEGLDSNESQHNTTLNDDLTKRNKNKYDSSRDIALARQITAGANIDDAIDNAEHSASGSSLFENSEEMYVQETGASPRGPPPPQLKVNSIASNSTYSNNGELEGDMNDDAKQEMQYVNYTARKQSSNEDQVITRDGSQTSTKETRKKTTKGRTRTARAPKKTIGSISSTRKEEHEHEG